MTFDDIETRIRAINDAEGNPLFSSVMTALDQQTVLSDGIVLRDSAFIVPVGEYGAQELEYTCRNDQSVTQKFAVIVAVRAINDRLGKNVNSRLETIYRTLRSNLIGWEPDDSVTPVIFVEGEIVYFAQGGAFWMETYSTTYTQKPSE